jgi:hypothetical protein
VPQNRSPSASTLTSLYKNPRSNWKWPHSPSNEPPPTLRQRPSVSSSQIAPSRSSTISLTSSISTITTISAQSAHRSDFEAFQQEECLPDFCNQHYLCQQIDRQSKAIIRITEACIRYLGDEACSHRVILIPQLCSSLTAPISLAQPISSSSNQLYSSRFLYLDSVRLAKQLASAILSFHDIPLLSNTLGSQDIIFYDTPSRPKRDRLKLTDPHLNVSMTTAQPSSTINKTSPQPVDTPPTAIRESKGKEIAHDTHIRNPYTYRLSVILLELACQTPLSKLNEEDSILAPGETPSTEFEIANSISKTLSTDMGLPSQKMVQKYLNCDFGCGADLQDPKLQEAVQKEVVGELENLEHKLSRLQIGD